MQGFSARCAGAPARSWPRTSALQGRVPLRVASESVGLELSRRQTNLTSTMEVSRGSGGGANPAWHHVFPAITRLGRRRERRLSGAGHLATELYVDELDESVADDLCDRLAALKRAEQRLAGGTYGSRSRAVGRSRDERLEVFPAAERTVEEERALDERGAS